jgi:chemotaxis protein CheD
MKRRHMVTRASLVKHVVGIAEMRVSATPGDLIVTHALGSCLGITVHDSLAGVGGLLHIMLPNSAIDALRAAECPLMFVDSGVPVLFKECYKLGASKDRMIVKVAGGACLHGSGDEDFFSIGKRNFTMLRKLLWKNGVLIDAYDVGGSISRTMSLEVGSGLVTVRTSSGVTTL